MNELDDLTILDTVISGDANDALTALALKNFLNWQFYGLDKNEKRRVYKTNVANNFLFRANNSMIDTTVISISEQIVNYNKRSKNKIDSPDIKQLRNHRHVMSHPATVEFDNPKVQAFYASREHYRDNLAVRIWKTRKLLTDLIESKGGRVINLLGVYVQPGICEMIQTILNLSRNPQFCVSSDEVCQKVIVYFKGFQEAIIKLSEKSLD